MKALLSLLFLLTLSSAADVSDLAAVETVPDAALPELQKDKQLLEDTVPIPEDHLFTCPSGWVHNENSCFLYVSSAQSWSNAEAHCHRQGASLVSVHSALEYSFLQSLTRGAGSVSAWMGGFYFQGWRWVNQSRFTYQSWYPLIYPNDNPCTYLQTHTIGWTNGDCGTLRPSICMRRLDNC